MAAWIAIAREVSGVLSAASTIRMSLHPWLNREMAAESPVGPAPTIKMDVCSGSMIISTEQCIVIDAYIYTKMTK